MPVSLTIDGSITIPDSELAKLKSVFTGPMAAPEDMIAKPAPAPVPVAPAPVVPSPTPECPAGQQMVPVHWSRPDGSSGMFRQCMPIVSTTPPSVVRPPTGPILMPETGAPPSAGTKPPPPPSGGGGGGKPPPSQVCSGDLNLSRIGRIKLTKDTRFTYDDPNGLNEWEAIEMSGDPKFITKEEWSAKVMLDAGLKPGPGFGQVDCSAGCPPDVSERVKASMLRNAGRKIYITKKDGDGDSCPTGTGRIP